MGSGSGSASSSAAQTGSHLHRSYQGTRSRHNDHLSNNGDNTLSTPSFDNGGVYLSNHGYSGDYGAYSSSRSSSSSNIHQPTPMVRNASSSSLMSECPVCGAILAGLEGGKAAQEAHVQDCLEVYKLPADSPLIDQECAICFEEFVAGRTVARLNCLCTYHRHCIHSWLQHGKACPTLGDEELTSKVKIPTQPLDYKAFVAIMSKNHKGAETSDDAYGRLFKSINKDGSGNVSSAELRAALIHFGNNSLSEADVDEIVHEADVSGDGRITLEEFLKIMQKSEKKLRGEHVL
ncbi:hypothetical protein BGZ74_005329 [Mortierella antarctica]|nr:hypothetical protein BGZ74_005329 [Mortierella antarctica]